MKVPRFTDNQGRTWPVEITVQTVKDLRRTLDFDLYTVIEPDSEMLRRLATDAVFLCDVLYVTCQRECQTREVSDEDFGRALHGDAIASATDAFLDAVEAFFQNARQAVMAKILTGNMKRAMTLAELMARSKNLHSLQEKLRAGFTDTPESSESTPVATA
jgi:hypothetical protein